MHIGVSGRGAPLAAPRRGPPDNLLSRVGNVRGRVNKCRILPAQFEKHGGQILCSRLHDDLPHLEAASEENEYKRQLEYFSHFYSASRDAANGSPARTICACVNE